MSYFAIECNGVYKDHFGIRDNDTNSVVFENYLRMTYDEMKLQEDLEDFVCAIMDVADSITDVANTDTVITLVGEDDIFIWSIIAGYVDDELRYVLVDWKKDGKSYKYTT